MLEQHGVDTTIIRMPANFPPSGTATRELSGMGTPDLLGTYGTFCVLHLRPDCVGRGWPGGRRRHQPGRYRGRRGARRARRARTIRFSGSRRRSVRAFTAYIDASRRFAKLVVGDEERLLRVGEWSDWVPVEFELVPSQRFTARRASI